MNPKLTLALSLLMGGISLTAGAQSPSPAATSPQVKPNQRCDLVSATGFIDGSQKIGPARIRLKCEKPVDTFLTAVCQVSKGKDDKPDELFMGCSVNLGAK
jgi:hypothetical protein